MKKFDANIEKDALNKKNAVAKAAALEADDIFVF